MKFALRHADIRIQAERVWLVLVPGNEPELLNPNQQAYALMGPPTKTWQEIPGASAGLIEPGTLDFSAKAASEWFVAHVPEPKPAEETPADASLNTPPEAN